MAQKTLSLYQGMPLMKAVADDVSETAYGLAHDAAEGSGNTGGTKIVSQYHHVPTVPPVDHEFQIRRFSSYFFIDVPDGSTINSATLSVKMMQWPDPFGAENWDWTVSIRYNSSLTGPVEPGSYDSADYATLLGGTQIASKYAGDISPSPQWVTYEFELADLVLIGEEFFPIVVPQTYLKLGWVSSKDLAGVAPDDTQRMLESVHLSVLQLILDYTLPTTDVDTDSATLVTGVSATLNGTLVYDGGEDCECSFEWGLTTDYGETTTAETKNTGETFSAGITELVPGTTYHFRAKAINPLGTFYGADRTFNSGGNVYPSITTTRVSSLIHRWVPGSYTLEVVLGGLTSEFALGIPSGKPTPTIPEIPSCPPGYVLSWSLDRGYFCISEADIPPVYPETMEEYY